MDFDEDDNFGMRCQGLYPEGIPCGNRSTAEGGPLLRCSKCSKLSWTGAVYCSIACQKLHWPEHKNVCVSLADFNTTLQPEIIFIYEKLSSWYHRNYTTLGEAALSAVDTVNFPENASRLRLDIYVSCHTTQKKPALTIRVERFRVVEMGHFAHPHSHHVAVLRPASPSGVVLLCVIRPIIPAVRDGVTIPIALESQALPYMLPSIQLHRQHVRGMPILNWREHFTAKLNKEQVIPDKLTLAATPTQYLKRSEEDSAHEQFRIAVMKWLQQHVLAVHGAAALAAYTEARPIQDNVVVVYICENPKSKEAKDQYLAVSASSYAVEDILPIFFGGSREMFDDKKRQMASLYKVNAKTLPLIFFQLVGTDFSVLLPLRDASFYPPFKHARVEEKSCAAKWKLDLLSALGQPDRNFVNAAYKEAGRG